METVEILRRAKAEIERRGWMQGGYGDTRKPAATCPVCMEGALQAAVHGDPFEYRQVSELDEAMEFLRTAADLDEDQALGDDWNDDTDRTKEDVLAAFDRAIALASPPPESQTPSTREGT